MRTTVNLRDDLYEAARRQAFEQRRTLGDVMNELIERGLSANPPRRQLGAFAGRITVAEDFDAPDPDLEETVDQSVEP